MTEEEKKLYDKVISSFIESWGFNGHHPSVLAIYSELKEMNKIWIYEKAYKDHYQL